MLIKEYRVLLPMTIEEYRIAHLWSAAQAYKENTGGGEGIEILKNEPFSNKSDSFPGSTTGQYTHKIYKLKSKVPWWIRKIVPKGALEIHEEGWNSYPYTKTIVNNPSYMKDNFTIKIETMHLADDGKTENVHQLPPELLQKREVVFIDIVNDHIPSSDYKEAEDPTKYRSEKTGRGPLAKNWRETTTPMICAYKLVTVEFKWFGIQGKVEHFLQKFEKRLFTKFHRQVFCWTDHWYGLTIEDIRRYEEDIQNELREAIKHGEVKGMISHDD